VECVLCGSSNTRTRSSVVGCNECGSAFTSTAPPTSYYEEQYAITQQSVDDTEHRRLFRFPEQIRWLRLIERECPPLSTLLDVGCDKGYFLDQARRHGYDVLGVEPSRAARSYCERVGLTVLPNLASVSKVFDIVTMWHSLEHFTDPNQAIENIYKLLKKPGHLFVRVPDYTCIWRRLTGERWIWYQPQNHYVHFSPDGLKTLLARHGFRSIVLHSQRPNDWRTNLSFSLASACFGRRPLKKTVGRFYEQLTGVEISCVAKC